MRVVADGATVKVYRKTGANMETEILSTTSAAITSSNKVGFATTFYAKYDIDDVWLLGNSLNNTTTFTVNNASELTSMSDNNGTTTFGSDDWGRLTSKGRGSYSATYAYGYGHRMSSASTNWPNETNVSYAYYGNGKRYRKSGGTTIKYKWLGNHVINEENDAGGLVTTYIGRTLADAIGSNPASANYRYYFHDHIGSTIRLTNQSRVTLSTSQYAPFGEPMEMLGEQHSHRFAGMEWDSDVQLHYALFRYYGPGSGRWTTRDPLGQSFGLNMYEYAISNPVNYADPHGLGFLEDCNAAMDLLKQKYNEAKQLLDQAAGIGVPMLIDEDAAPPPPIKPSDIVDAIVDDAIDDATSNQGGDSSSGDEGGESTDAPDPIPQGGTSQSPPPTGGNPPYYKSHPNTNIDDALDQLDGIQAAQDKYKKGGLPDKIRSIDKSKQRVPKGGGTPRDYGAGNDDD
jgi:RHS repeat-associated protein